MPTQDEEFLKRLRATFLIEAQEHLQAMSTSLLALEKQPPSQRAAHLETAYREAHSLKGAARAVDMADIESICQALESVFSAWKQKAVVPAPDAFDLLHQVLDITRQFVEPDAPRPQAALQDARQIIRQLSALSWPSIPAHEPPAGPPPPAIPPGASVAPAEPEKTAGPETVRIALSKLDAQLLQAEDLLTVKAIAAQRSADLRELSESFDHWRKQWATVSAAARSLGAPESAPPAGENRIAEFLDWNSNFIRTLESSLASLAAKAHQDRHAIDRRIDDLLEDSKKLLMLPFSSITGTFPRLIRDLCRDQQKDAELIIHGASVELDKRILEEMKDALIHILRNAVDHGVEPPAQRLRLQKSPRATVSIRVSQVNGSKVEISVSDDGRGIDIQRIKESAIRHGLLTPPEAGKLADADALPLAFQSDVSTSPNVTAISGRGLGMAIVRAKAEKLGGHVTLESRPAQGTTLRIVLPTTLATFRGVFVQAAQQTFILPATSVERIARIMPGEISTVENREVVSLAGQVLSLARLPAVLELLPPSHPEPRAGPLPVLILQAAGQRIAFAVDEVLREEEVLVKPLKKPLVRVRHVSGAAVASSGKAALILNVNDLLAAARRHGIPPSPAQLPAARAQTPAQKILVVEDSITSRMLLKGILESAGYQVATAVDGLDAFTQLRENPFDLVVSDVEMPRLGGFDLTARIRADARLKELPVVLVTALESREQRERGIDAGASAYIIKSRFDQSNLLDVIRRLI